MSDLNIPNMPAVLPAPRAAVSIHPATIDDLPFIDGLQKRHTLMVGWMPTKQLEGKIRAGQVLVAEEDETRRQGEGETRRQAPTLSPCLPLSLSPCLGYVIGHDQYFKRDDVGIIY